MINHSSYCMLYHSLSVWILDSVVSLNLTGMSVPKALENGTPSEPVHPFDV